MYKRQVLETITIKLSRKERKTTTNHQQNQNSPNTQQPILETIEKIIPRTKSKVDISSSIKLFQVDESYTMQDIPHKKMPTNKNRHFE